MSLAIGVVAYLIALLQMIFLSAVAFVAGWIVTVVMYKLDSVVRPLTSKCR